MFGLVQSIQKAVSSFNSKHALEGTEDALAETIPAPVSLSTVGAQSHARQPKKAAAATIDKADVMVGDILLLEFEHDYDRRREFNFFMDMALQAIEAWRNWGKYTKEEKQEKFKALMPLIHLAIALFDDNKFFHAAIVGHPEIGQATLKQATLKNVIEAGPSGIHGTPLDDYYGGRISVYRYHKGAVSLGDAALPSGPVVGKANEFLCDGTIQYGYPHAGLLAIWCLYRRGEDFAVARLEEVLIQLFGSDESAKRLIKLLFAASKGKIKTLLQLLVLDALALLRQPNQMVCSELVAACFNEAGDEGTYHISRESNADRLTALTADIASVHQGVFAGLDPGHVEKRLTELGEAFANLDIEEPMRSVDIALELVEQNNLYTPADLQQSANTFHVGDMGEPKVF